jgi:hypothetical protein
MALHTHSVEIIDKDIEYLQTKLNSTIDEVERTRLLKQIKLLNDTITLYNSARAELKAGEAH